MKAVILVGGRATRLLPLTCNLPKAMVPVLNRPFLEHVIRYLGRYQVKEIVLAQGHLAQPIEGYLGDGSQLGVKLIHSVEATPRGTAGAVKNVERYLDEPFLVLNGDVFSDLDVMSMVRFHQERKARVTIALTPVDDPSSYGLIETDTEGRVTRFLEKPAWSQATPSMINAGTYILEPDVLAEIPPEREVSFEREVFPQLLARGEPVYAYSSSTYWIDIGTPEKYLQLHWDLLDGKCSHYSFPVGEKVVVGGDSNIHPTVQIEGPVVIGSGCFIGGQVKLRGPLVIGDRCNIMGESTIQESILWRNAWLGPRVAIRKSILANDCCLNANSTVEESVLGEGVTIAPDCRLKPGSKIWPGTTVEARG